MEWRRRGPQAEGGHALQPAARCCSPRPTSYASTCVRGRVQAGHHHHHPSRAPVPTTSSIVHVAPAGRCPQTPPWTHTCTGSGTDCATASSGRGTSWRPQLLLAHGGADDRPRPRVQVRPLVVVWVVVCRPLHPELQGLRPDGLCACAYPSRGCWPSTGQQEPPFPTWLTFQNPRAGSWVPVAPCWSRPAILFRGHRLMVAGLAHARHCNSFPTSTSPAITL